MKNVIDLSLLEPVVMEHCPDATPTFQAQYSAAVSLKRIADVLSGDGIADLLRTPVNNYGESFTDAIQMAFVRGQRGDDRT